MYIDLEHNPKVLLLGNGINRAYDFASWDELIKSIQTKSFTEEEEKCIKNIPYPLQPVILTGDEISDQMKEIAVELTDLRATSEEEVMLRDFVELPFDAILTTNYTYELEKAINSKFDCKVGRKCKFRQKTEAEAGKDTTSLLHTYFKLDENSPSIWHIHGEAAKYDTMILGHYYYGKLLSKIQQYIPTLKKRVAGNYGKLETIKCMSWIDYFMLGEVHVVGLGLHPSELDLWWLINCKKRHFPKTKVFLYKPDISVEDKLLAEAYGIDVKTDGLVGKNYKAYYNLILESLIK